MSAYSRGVAWAESALTPLAERLVMALEDPVDEVLGPRTPVRDLEAELLQGTATEVAAARAAAQPGPGRWCRGWRRQQRRAQRERTAEHHAVGGHAAAQGLRAPVAAA